MSMKTGFFLSSGEAANNKEAVLQESKRLAGFFQATIVKLPARFFPIYLAKFIGTLVRIR